MHDVSRVIFYCSFYVTVQKNSLEAKASRLFSEITINGYSFTTFYL